MKLSEVHSQYFPSTLPPSVFRMRAGSLMWAILYLLMLPMATAQTEVKPAPLGFAGSHRTPPSPLPEKRFLRQAVRQMPLTFVPNEGQEQTPTRFTAHGAGFQLALEKDGLSILTLRPKPGASIPVVQSGSAAMAAPLAPANPARDLEPVLTQVHFVGANPAVKMEGLDPSEARVNYFLGSDPAKWKRSLPAYSRVRYTNLYPGIDLVYYGEKQRHLEYDLVVAPGADPSRVRLRVDGSHEAEIDDAGNLRLDGKDGQEGSVLLHRPMLYQDIAKGKKVIAGAFVQLTKNEFGFKSADYDHAKPLIIDPTLNLLYSTYMGGRHEDDANDIVVDAAGNSYIAGSSASEDFPLSGNAYLTTRTDLGTYTYDVAVLKFSSSGSLLYSTFIGGTAAMTGDDLGKAIAVDAAGNAYITGSTASPDFPTTANAYATTAGGTFLSELSPDGSTLEYSTYYNATGGANDIALNAKGQVVIAGASGPGLATTTGAYKATLASGIAAFVAVFDPTKAGSQQLVSATYYGTDSPIQNASTIGNDVLGFAIDSTGNIWIGGQAYTPNLPTTANAYQTSLPSLDASCDGNGAVLNSAAYFAELSSDLTKLQYATYFSGKTEGANIDDCSEYANHLVFDSAGNLYVTGATASASFPVTAGVFQGANPSAGGDTQSDFVGWVAKFAPNQQAPLWSSYFGGNGGDTFFSGSGHGSVIDSAGNLWTSGNTQGGSNFPISSNAYQTAFGGFWDGFVSQISPDGKTVVYSTYLGGAGYDTVNAIDIDAQNTLYLAGATASTNFPVSSTAFQSQYGEGCPSGCDGNDMVFAIFGGGTIGTFGPIVGGNDGDTSLTVEGAGFESGATCSLVLGTATIASTYASVAQNGTAVTCTFTLSGAATGSYDVVIHNPDATTFTKPGAFTVEAATGPNLGVNVVGRSAIRNNTPTAFNLTVSNTGDENAYSVLINVSYPSTATLTFTYGSLPPLPSGKPFDGTGVPQTYTQGGTTNQILYLPVVTAGSANSYSFQITDATTGDAPTISVQAAYGSTTIGSTTTSSIDEWAPSKLRTNLFPGGARAIKPVACAGDIIGGIASAFGPAGCIPGAALSLLIGSVVSGFDGGVPNLLTDGAGFAWWAVQTAAPSCLGLIPGVGQAAGAAYGAWQALGDCGGQGYQNAIVHVITKGSLDPNDKAGSSGDGSASHYINLAKPLAYSLGFENTPTATAPASQVVVTDQLDPAKVNLSAVTLGAIQFGGHVINLPAGVTNYNTVNALSSTLNVRIQGSLNATTGLLKWTFTSIDPSTGLPPTDPSVGFLPPDTDGVVGQGSVVFNVMPQAALTTGTQINNTATVIFDQNAPIKTPTWLNTVDVTAPQSAVTALAPQVVPPFKVAWSGTDQGSGIATYNVYVSDNGAAATLWQKAVTATSASYMGTAGHTYGFYSIASDGAGNVEAAKTAADTTTMAVASIAPPVAPGFSLSATPATLSVAPGSSATNTLTVTPVGGFKSPITFTCSGLPAYTTCSFSPATVTPTGNNTAVTTQLSIATNISTAQSARGVETVWALLLLGAGGLVRARRRLGSHYGMVVLLYLLLAGLPLVSVGCGGGGSPKATTTTPAGTSTVTVTATAGTTVEKATLTLTIQ